MMENISTHFNPTSELATDAPTTPLAHSESLPNLHPAKAQRVRLAISDNDLRLPASRQTKQVSFLTPESQETAQLFLHTLISTLHRAIQLHESPEPNQSFLVHEHNRHYVSLDELQENLFLRFSNNIKLTPLEQRPKNLRAIHSSTEGQHYLEALFKHLLTIISPLVERFEFEQKPRELEPKMKLTAPKIEALKHYLENNHQKLVLIIGNHLEHNAPEPPALKEQPSLKAARRNRTVRLSELKKHKIKPQQSVVHDIGYRLRNYDHIPQAGDHFVTQKKTFIGKQPLTITATEKVPELNPEAVSAHIINEILQSHSQEKNLGDEQADDFLLQLKARFGSDYVKKEYPKLFEKKPFWRASLQKINAQIRSVTGNADEKIIDEPYHP